MESLVDKVIANPQKETFKELRDAVHKLSGSAGSYGYVKAGNTCKELELTLHEADKNNAYPESLPAVKERFKKIKFYFSTENQTGFGKSSSKALQPVEKGTVFVISKDQSIIKTFQKASEVSHSHIDIEKKPEEALSTLRGMDHKPELFITEKNFSENNLKGLDLIRNIKNEFVTSQMKFGLIVEDDNLEENLQASKEGIDIILKKPLSLSRVEILLEHLFERKSKESFRVLVVDDDEDVRSFITNALNSPDVTVLASSDETKILDNLYSFNPNLLLLDINLPQHSGWTLLKALRSDLRYKNLKIIMITSVIPSGTSMYKETFDDIWIKPLNEAVLKQKVSQMALNLLPETENESLFATFISLDKFKRLLQKEIDFRKDPNRFLIIIGSSDYKLAIKEGTGAKTEYLIACENAINQTISNDLLRGYLGEGRFALYFANTEASELEALMDKFIKDSEYQILIGRNEEVYNTFSSLIIPIQKEDVSAEELIKFGLSSFEQNLVLPSQKLTVAYT